VPPHSAAGPLPTLDGVRGLAVLLVLFTHVTSGEHHPARAESLAIKVVDAGWAGVDLFFVLAGFLIAGLLLRDKGRPRYFRNFYGRRALGLFPLYFGLPAAGLLAARLGRLCRLFGRRRPSPSRPSCRCSSLYRLGGPGVFVSPPAGGAPPERSGVS
jgi:hypothetical protein